MNGQNVAHLVWQNKPRAITPPGMVTVNFTDDFADLGGQPAHAFYRLVYP